jgi:hypothetical protein
MFGLPEGPSSTWLATLDELTMAAGVPPSTPEGPEGCPALAFARSGAMWITGTDSPVPIDFPLLVNLQTVCDGIEELSARLSTPVRVDPAVVVTQRAADRGFRRRGRRSANGSCQLLRGPDGWLACNLARPSDLELLPAIVGTSPGNDPWGALQRAAATQPVDELVERAQLVGVAAARLEDRPPEDFGPPVRFERLGPAQPGSQPGLVLDLSAMWAGPLCAQVLRRCGVQVWTVEDPARPDGARFGDPGLYLRLHQGHHLLQISLTSDHGRRELADLMEKADVVVESSRPRALAAFGLTPERFLAAAPGRVWISLTGYGRRGEHSNRVAFGDDAAVAGGLVAWEGDQPVFCADALADPVSGLFAALGGLLALADGGGVLVEVSMRNVSAAIRVGTRCPAQHPVESDGRGGWLVSHDGTTERVVEPGEVIAGAHG